MHKAEAVTKTYTKPSQLPQYGSLSTIVREVGTSGDVLDVGCSEGYLAQYLPNHQVWGVDGNEVAVAAAQQVCKEAKLMDLNELPSKPVFKKRFDYIVFADVLEHLLYPEQVLKHFEEYLKPGGTIIISVPNIALWRVRLNLLLGRFNYTDYGVMDRTHLHLYTFKTAPEMMMAAGFRVTKLQGAANLLGPVVSRLPFLKGLVSIHVIVSATNQ